MYPHKLLTMKLFFSLSFLFLSGFISHSQSASSPTKKTKVILLGVFHFNNPGLDLAKYKDTDILSAKSQKEIQFIVDAIAKLKPTKVFLEGNTNYQPKMDSLFAKFLNGKLLSDKDETVQIGFRLMKQLNINKSYCVDAAGDLPADSLIKTWQMSGQQNYFEEFMSEIKKVEKEDSKNIEAGVSIVDRVRQMNTPEYRKKDLSMYSSGMMMKAGKPENFIGADVATAWYQRNIRIYSNVVRELSGDEECIFIMFGASHIPIIEHLFSLKDEFTIVNVPLLLSQYK